MKAKKILNIAIVAIFFSVVFVGNALAVIEPAGGGNGEPVGVPLDGGLLALLAGAGAAYYTARKKKNRKSEG